MSYFMKVPSVNYNLLYKIIVKKKKKKVVKDVILQLLVYLLWKCDEILLWGIRLLKEKDSFGY